VNKKWHNFIGFWDDMGSSYNEILTLDRINVNGNYTKSNCRWVSQTKQQRNRSNNLYVKYKDSKKLLKDLCEEYNVNYNLVWQRVFKYNWDLNDALIIKSRRKKHG
jgi:hypothetical protein